MKESKSTFLTSLGLQRRSRAALSAPLEQRDRESEAQSIAELLLSAQEFYGVSHKRPFGIPKHGRFQAVLFPADMQTMRDRQAAKEIKMFPDLVIIVPI